MNNYQIKTASLNDINCMLDWAKQEGWGLGLYDALPYHITDPQGFFMGYLENQPIASISAVRYADQFGFVGLYMVKPHYRGQGYGLAIWQQAMRYLYNCNIGLDGIPTQQENYRKSGFVFAYHHLHYAGAPIKINNTENIVDARTVSFNLLTDYLQKFFPAARPTFWAAWLNMSNTYSLAIIEKGHVVGFGVIRPCQGGYTIAPLYAQNMNDAHKLYGALCMHVDAETIFLDVPEINAAAIELANQIKLKPLFKAARMYTGNFPEIDLTQVFGVTSMTLG